jgi:4-alpha-glucanotransferase
MESVKFSRPQGILLHLTSLPGDYGCGGLGKEAYEFIDYLKANGYSHWQILPLNYPGYGDSPYNPISSFAGNPFLIDPVKLQQAGLLSIKDLDKARLPNPGMIHFKHLYTSKLKMLRSAYVQFRSREKITALTDYLEREAYWLKPFIAFSFFKEQYKNKAWQLWRQEDRFYSETLFRQLYKKTPDCLLFHVFMQFCFDRQLQDLKQYAVQQDIHIIGDLPLYVSLDSSDVWSRPDLFELDAAGNPLRVAGVPPDAFSETGQLWGNPLYRWDRLQEEGFEWWKHRLHKAFAFADSLRLDHFIGLVNYWAVESKEKSAVKGQWLPGPKHAFFDSILKVFPAERFIAEDLGILTDEVNAIRDHYGFPGMIILQFCFQHEFNDILSFPENKIIYTGTHDNQTTRGLFLQNKKENKPDNGFLEAYLRKVGFLPEQDNLTDSNVSPMLIKLAQASPCRLCIIPMQDILSLTDKARLNIPGTALGNWRWRLQ